jgi:hypothetical protein
MSVLLDFVGCLYARADRELALASGLASGHASA